ncbi:protein tyrosine phosphatase [Piedraia hortae CBS 480.64]|uniref:Very-long-chain (3R)-3-hydroxyacyl-CoA dehydratase n=1 Tax=Piedraia hortae CBS 480.64 TaxID=1314780 RepID=A0A6A7C3B9_9PEZI|nr:protein tyrosine phosphatase [Piedraia hortae CBS 480.64]
MTQQHWQVSSLSPKRLYLILYNLVSSFLWSIVLSRAASFALTKGFNHTYQGVGEFTKWTQTLAVLEILHAALGIVRAPLMTTVMQVASRLLLVWGICHNFPQVPASSLAYTTMLVAWSLTEVVRYSYFAINLSSGNVPAFLTWARYNAFFALYPLGISSECWLVGKSIGPAAALNPVNRWLLWAVLAIYIPGSYFLYTHMMAQRKKVMRAQVKQA